MILIWVFGIDSTEIRRLVMAVLVKFSLENIPLGKPLISRLPDIILQRLFPEYALSDILTNLNDRFYNALPDNLKLICRRQFNPKHAIFYYTAYMEKDRVIPDDAIQIFIEDGVLVANPNDFDYRKFADLTNNYSTVAELEQGITLNEIHVKFFNEISEYDPRIINYIYGTGKGYHNYLLIILRAIGRDSEFLEFVTRGLTEDQRRQYFAKIGMKVPSTANDNYVRNNLIDYVDVITHLSKPLSEKDLVNFTDFEILDHLKANIPYSSRNELVELAKSMNDESANIKIVFHAFSSHYFNKSKDRVNFRGQSILALIRAKRVIGFGNLRSCNLYDIDDLTESINKALHLTEVINKDLWVIYPAVNYLELVRINMLLMDQSDVYRRFIEAFNHYFVRYNCYNQNIVTRFAQIEEMTDGEYHMPGILIFRILQMMLNIGLRLAGWKIPNDYALVTINLARCKPQRSDVIKELMGKLWDYLKSIQGLISMKFIQDLPLVELSLSKGQNKVELPDIVRQSSFDYSYETDIQIDVINRQVEGQDLTWLIIEMKRYIENDNTTPNQLLILTWLHTAIYALANISPESLPLIDLKMV